MPTDRKEIQFRQLCALVKAIILRDPTIDDAEWKARAHDTMAKWGFKPAPGDMVVRAMTQVEFAVRKTLGSRPTPTPSTVNPQPKLEIAPPWEKRSRRPAGWDIVAALMAKLQPSPNSARTSERPPDGPREVLPIDEDDALTEFWRMCQERPGERVAVLRAFAEIAIVRPADWDYDADRRDARNITITNHDGCFGCRDGMGKLAWHHIIQVQFGGSNNLRNRVRICEACHSDIHPWLPDAKLVSGGFAHITSGFESASDLIRAIQRRSGVA